MPNQRYADTYLRGNIMTKLSQHLKNLWNDESGQGATEYILLLVVVVGVVMMFKGEIMKALTTKLGTLSSDITNFNGNQ
jgi:Flp pilus assembly pilin Flp